MPIELKVPTVGESITEVQIGPWQKGEGTWARKDEPLVEIETDKATVELSAPENGTVVRILKQQGERATVGEVIGYFEERREPVGAASGPPIISPAAVSEHPEKVAPAVGSAKASADAPTRVMPAAQRMLAENSLAPGDVVATGPGGRVLKEDVARRVEAQPPATREKTPATPLRAEKIVTGELTPSLGQPARSEKVVPMSLLRQRIAERLVEAQQNAALLTTFNEIDMSAVIELRSRYREPFQQKHGVKLGFMSFFVRASIDALGLFPGLNAEIRGTDIVYHNYYDIGVAIGGGKGLVVPVLRNAQLLGFAQIETAIADYARRASENKLELHELQGGTFTISNGGVYGSLLSTPIVNPPQSGILGLHAINDRPIAVEGQVVIRPMMYVAVTYDHRLIDGREAVTFLKHIKEVIEDPSRLLLEV